MSQLTWFKKKIKDILLGPEMTDLILFSDMEDNQVIDAVSEMKLARGTYKLHLIITKTD